MPVPACACSVAVRRMTSTVSLDQLVLLIALNLLLAFFVDLLSSLPHPEFYSYAVAANGLDVLLLLFAVYLVSKLLMDNRVALRLAVYLYSMSPFFLLLWVMLGRLEALLPPDGDRHLRGQLSALPGVGDDRHRLGTYPAGGWLLTQGPGSHADDCAGLDAAGLLFCGEHDTLVCRGRGGC